MNLAKKYAPKKPKDLVGRAQQEAAASLLDNIERGDVPRLVLLTGPSGVGKTSIATMCATKILDGKADLIEHVNCNDAGSVGWVRESLIPTFHRSPMYSSHKVWFLDELHGITSKGQEALLVEFERLPDHVAIFAATTDPGQLKDTLTSRFEHNRYDLPSPSRNELASFLARIFKEEGINIDSEQGRFVEDPVRVVDRSLAFELIDSCGGNVRTLLGLMGKVKEGSYTPTPAIDLEDTSTIVGSYINSSPSYADLFGKLGGSDYEAERIRMLKYAGVVVKRGSGNRVEKAKRVIWAFGEPFSSYNQTGMKWEFARRLLMLYNSS